MKTNKVLAIALETLGGCITLAGVITEWITMADYGYCIITGGALVASVGAMIYAKFIKCKWDEEDKE
jgi:hypothetical protein